MNSQTKINILVICLLLIILNEYILNKIFNKKEGFNVKKLKNIITKKFKSIKKQTTKATGSLLKLIKKNISSIEELFILIITFPLLIVMGYIIITSFIPFCISNIPTFISAMLSFFSQCFNVIHLLHA